MSESLFQSRVGVSESLFQSCVGVSEPPFHSCVGVSEIRIQIATSRRVRI